VVAPVVLADGAERVLGEEVQLPAVLGLEVVAGLIRSLEAFREGPTLEEGPSWLQEAWESEGVSFLPPEESHSKG